MDVGEAMRRMAEVKDSLDIDVKQNFIDPLQGLCDKDLKEIQVGSETELSSPSRVSDCPLSVSGRTPNRAFFVFFSHSSTI